MSEVFKALSDPTRRHVLELLRSAPLSAGDIGDHFNFSQPTMSGHLTVLKQAGLIEGEKIGKQIIYTLKMSVLESALMGFAKTFGLALEQSAGDDVASSETEETKPNVL
jgi:ArsR family transcriptional regulator, repressor of sdpIR and other operons